MIVFRPLLRTLVALACASLVASGARANEHDAFQALMAWNNFTEAVRFSDECSGSNDFKALRPLSPRVEVAISRIIMRYPQLAALGSAGDTDYVCILKNRVNRSGHYAVRRKAAQLIRKLEIEAGR